MKNEESSKRKKKERKGKEERGGKLCNSNSNKQTNKPDKHTEKKLDRQNGMGDRI